MARRLAVISLIITLISSNLSWFFAYAGYKVNQKYISERLCVNRSRPWMHCNGQCYLMKKYRQAQERERNHDRQLQRNLLQNINVISIADIKFHNTLLQIISTPYRPLEPIIFSGSVFHPPKLA